MTGASQFGLTNFIIIFSMPKLLRPDEKLSFVQTRAPTAMWRYAKRLGIDHAVDGTATRLCTDHMLEYMATRRWLKDSWLRPQALQKKDGGTGYQQVNLPLSNMDEGGKIITSVSYLKAHGLLGLVDRDKHALRAAIETSEFAQLIYLAAAQLQVSGATFAFSFLHWLTIVKFGPKTEVQFPSFDPAELPEAKRVAVEVQVQPRRGRPPSQT